MNPWPITTIISVMKYPFHKGKFYYSLTGEFYSFSFSDIPPPMKIDRAHFQECLIEMLEEMFGGESVSKIVQNNRITVEVDQKVAVIHIDSQVCVLPSAFESKIYLIGLSMSITAF